MCKSKHRNTSYMKTEDHMTPPKHRRASTAEFEQVKFHMKFQRCKSNSNHWPQGILKQERKFNLGHGGKVNNGEEAHKMDGKGSNANLKISNMEKVKKEDLRG